MGKPVSGSHFGTNLGTPWMEMEGTSNVTLAFEDGAMGYHFGTWGARGSRLRYSFHAHCEEGMLEIRLRDGILVLHSDAKKHLPGEADNKQTETILLHAPSAKPTEAELAHFLDCIASGAKPLTDGVSSLEGLQVIWKLYEAEQAGRLADLRGTGLGTATV
jgi:predicted dehydrogenase